MVARGQGSTIFVDSGAMRVCSILCLIVPELGCGGCNLVVYKLSGINAD